ncbi:hypothetical protein FNH22_08335 [Fulvivirga sp. M361]|uniref:hypothetical protein n=1 Tax=Fulvivirga sp. M361 TaxID=2594266 RepID=UPI00117B2ED1|nr:hypothetical protein [Fulvivirga sp. M361]TRX60048.1 hypothetical protein FNH22_08335 [Fulvivirga sp. M361]
MQKITLMVKDDSKISFFLELIKQFDFIEVQRSSRSISKDYNFFESAGLWKDRNVTGDQLREQAWKRDN